MKLVILEKARKLKRRHKNDEKLKNVRKELIKLLAKNEVAEGLRKVVERCSYYYHRSKIDIEYLTYKRFRCLQCQHYEKIEEVFIDSEEASKMLSIAPSTIFTYCREGKIDAVNFREPFSKWQIFKKSVERVKEEK